ncbi:hypothetical protein GH714_028285 [Hevea brasiliensis]|uniref:Protein MIZU-KUSSEI 1 n=1 Tax=Hevea brasiliensis TaxID=3981 RepID=A0A6A6LFQ4_HEVBR|nr:hypothetical protein GH714_028285 [Hevea brasiliensis]
MARASQDDSSSKRHFHWTKKIGTENDEVPTFKSSSNSIKEDKKENARSHAALLTPKKLPAVAVARLRSVLSAFGKNRSNLPLGLGPRVVGTLFGYRRGHVHFAFQRDPNSTPAFLIELATPISGLVREMASGRECGPKEWKVLKAVEPISMGAGVLPGIAGDPGADGELMYMRAKFERIVGSRDSEAFYMMNPDSNGAPELSIYLLRV